LCFVFYHVISDMQEKVLKITDYKRRDDYLYLLCYCSTLIVHIGELIINGDSKCAIKICKCKNCAFDLKDKLDFGLENDKK
jgi:hypothetical protein